MQDSPSGEVNIPLATQEIHCRALKCRLSSDIRSGLLLLVEDCVVGLFVRLVRSVRVDLLTDSRLSHFRPLSTNTMHGYMFITAMRQCLFLSDRHSTLVEKLPRLLRNPTDRPAILAEVFLVNPVPPRKFWDSILN
jgi:hypothetical protein